MYSNNIIPNYNMNIRRQGFGIGRRNDRFFGGGFAVPFLLGGITGGLLANRPNNFYGYQQPFPVAVPFYPYPYYSNNYYYY